MDKISADDIKRLLEEKLGVSNVDVLVHEIDESGKVLGKVSNSGADALTELAKLIKLASMSDEERKAVRDKARAGALDEAVESILKERRMMATASEDIADCIHEFVPTAVDFLGQKLRSRSSREHLGLLIALQFQKDYPEYAQTLLTYCADGQIMSIVSETSEIIGTTIEKLWDRVGGRRRSCRPLLRWPQFPHPGHH